jgi:hypothetical protein
VSIVNEVPGVISCFTKGEMKYAKSVFVHFYWHSIIMADVGLHERLFTGVLK